MQFEVFRQNYCDDWFVGVPDRNGDDDTIIARFANEDDANKKCNELNNVLSR